jgi:hypothetical protein
MQVVYSDLSALGLALAAGAAPGPGRATDTAAGPREECAGGRKHSSAQHGGSGRKNHRHRHHPGARLAHRARRCRCRYRCRCCHRPPALRRAKRASRLQLEGPLATKRGGTERQRTQNGAVKKPRRGTRAGGRQQRASGAQRRLQRHQRQRQQRRRQQRQQQRRGGGVGRRQPAEGNVGSTARRTAPLLPHPRARTERQTRAREREQEQRVRPTRVECGKKSPGSLRRDFCIQSPTRLRIQGRGVTL